MTFDEAVALVVADQRESYPDITVDEAVAHARNTISVEGGIGAAALYTDEELVGASAEEIALNDAYRLVVA